MVCWGLQVCTVPLLLADFFFFLISKRGRDTIPYMILPCGAWGPESRSSPLVKCVFPHMNCLLTLKISFFILYFCCYWGFTTLDQLSQRDRKISQHQNFPHCTGTRLESEQHTQQNTPIPCARTWVQPPDLHLWGQGGASEAMEQCFRCLSPSLSLSWLSASLRKRKKKLATPSGGVIMHLVGTKPQQ